MPPFVGDIEHFGLVAAVNGTEQSVVLCETEIGEDVAADLERFDRAFPQAGASRAHRTEAAVPFNQLGIFVSPRVAAAVEGILVALHAGFVAVVNTRYAGEGELQHGCQTKQAQTALALLGERCAVLLPFASAVACRLAAQYRDGTPVSCVPMWFMSRRSTWGG